nr:PREDICTED: uncharacterized protein LOC106706565 [Latimeria chalumnae]|eukprot:XP_014353173.1 PREDICTED: uncharacterized protein LOC106706565 [Latimeria chalumnae]
MEGKCPSMHCWDDLLSDCTSCKIIRGEDPQLQEDVTTQNVPKEFTNMDFSDLSHSLQESALAVWVTLTVGIIVLAIVLVVISWRKERQYRATKGNLGVEAFEEQEKADRKEASSAPEENEATWPLASGTLEAVVPVGRSEQSAQSNMVSGGKAGLCHREETRSIRAEGAGHACSSRGDHTFPLPATELGATVLVTTKTTQNSNNPEAMQK